jgi:hypothetical protein
MPSQDTFTLVLAIVSVLIVIWLLLPNILAILGRNPLQNGMAGGSEDADLYWPTKLDGDLYQEMLALGFKPLGTYWEQMPLKRRFEEFVFHRPGEKCFGLLYPNDQIMPRRASFLTVFESGGVAFTKNYSGGVEVQEGDFLAVGAQTEPVRDLPPSTAGGTHAPWQMILLAGAVGLLLLTFMQVGHHSLSSDQRVMVRVLCGVAILAALTHVRPVVNPPRRTPRSDDLDLRIPLAETLARHRLNVNRLLAQGQQPPARFDADEFIATQERYHAHPRLRRQYQSSMSWLLRGKLIVLALLPGVLFAHLGFQSALPWGALLVEGIIGLFLRYGCSSATVVHLLRLGRGKRRA